MFIKVNSLQIEVAFKEFYSKKPFISNFYNPNISEGELLQTDKSLIIRKDAGQFYRNYLLSTDKNEIIELLKNMNGTNVINIPSKGAITEWNHILTHAGYELQGIYQRWYNPNVTFNNIVSPVFASIDHVDILYNMLYDNFCSYFDHLPSRDELETMISRNQVLINKEGEEVKGLFLYTFVKEKCYYNCWYDSSANGLYLLFTMHGIMRQNKISHAYLWINSKNEKVKKIYSLLGYKHDGLIDYTYIK
jgi:hypothetical protein